MSLAFWLGLAVGAAVVAPGLTWWQARRLARRRHLAQRHEAAERLQEIGTLTGGLAHEIKNPLSTIGLNLQMLQEDIEALEKNLPEDRREPHVGRIRRRFDSLSRESQRLREILDEFLRFAGRMNLERESTDVNRLLDDLATFFEPQAEGAGVHIRRQLKAEPAAAPVDAGLLKQALLNLMLNATQAMSEARKKDQDHGGCDELILKTARGRGLGADELLIHVIDTGPGMDAETAGKIFQPYFSTKRGGTGLGLPSARRIVEEHGGRIDVHSERGRGTDFTIGLPTEMPEAADDTAAPEQSADGRDSSANSAAAASRASTA